MARSTVPGMVVTRTPLRVSFAGGGTDLPAFYEREYGAVLGTTIRQYVYVTVKRHGPVFGAPIRLNYSETEQVNCLEDLKNDVARACLQFLEVDVPVYVSTVADVPAASGLGSSSAFAVGLLNALHTWRQEQVSAAQLAAEAVHVELKMLRRPIGKQDQYAAAFGGFNFYRFLENGSVSIEPQEFEPGGLADMFEHLMLFWTGITRNAHDVLAEQRQHTAERIDELTALREQAHALQSSLRRRFDPCAFGQTIHAGWHVKRTLASNVSNTAIDDWYERALRAGAFGGKICGAGGGGVLLLVVCPERRAHVRAALHGLVEIPMDYEPRGSRVLLPELE
jgi:D-glycero-alpha-D-manno-heptose-7-phosphate kinase